MFFNNYLRFCNAIGKTPSAVATEIGLQKSTVSRWSKGSTPNHATVVKVADYFNVPVYALTTDFDLNVFAINLAHHLELNMYMPQDLAKKTGIDINTINGLLTGDRYPQKDEIDSIAKCLLIMEDDLTKAWSHQEEHDEMKMAVWLDSDTYDLMGKYKGLSPAQKKAVRQVVETFHWGTPGNWEH